MCDVSVHEVDRHAGSTSLGAGLVERLRDEVNRGDVPTVLRQVNRRVSGATPNIQRRRWRQCGCVSRSLNQLQQRFRMRMTVPRSKAESVKDPEQVVSRSHYCTVFLGGRGLLADDGSGVVLVL